MPALRRGELGADSHYGLDMASGPLAADINTLFRYLSVVANNSKASVGGGGRPHAAGATTAADRRSTADLAD